MHESTPKVEGDKREYYPNRPLARTAANRGQFEYEDKGAYSALVQFEPGKGYVAVLVADKNIPEAWDAGFEVQTPKLAVKEKTPDDWAAPKKPKPSETAADGGRPMSGATARVHAIADKLREEGVVSSRADRAKVIQACIEAGINKATAGTQWAKYAKNQGW